MDDGGTGVREFGKGLMHGFPDGAKEVRGYARSGMRRGKGVVVGEKGIVVKLRRVIPKL